ncbi:demethoxyubiquinone hydroxylase family protein [Ralstonia flaminis]|jgi:ubiquinone biosynthesis monooxygenase Coq7|uniref:demethoxyubiquinone hydroxylase family protein n=1 Tax=Ralstonia flaminis TaxID=3058597 RepID=UPI002931A5DE|nr:demethoxyubiquinone hydroxylase family protein [Ralstonia sp. LMG 18101]
MVSTEQRNLGDRYLKVDHAGEHGAICIYTGQIAIARLFFPDLVPELIQFRSDERNHRAIFGAELERRGLRRCRSYWLCGAGGLALGVLTGLLGRTAVSATTVAVESVVLRHLEQQLAALTRQPLPQSPPLFRKNDGTTTMRLTA